MDAALEVVVEAVVLAEAVEAVVSFSSLSRLIEWKVAQKNNREKQKIGGKKWRKQVRQQAIDKQQDEEKEREETQIT